MQPGCRPPAFPALPVKGLERAESALVHAALSCPCWWTMAAEGLGRALAYVGWTSLQRSPSSNHEGQVPCPGPSALAWLHPSSLLSYIFISATDRALPAQIGWAPCFHGLMTWLLVPPTGTSFSLIAIYSGLSSLSLPLSLPSLPQYHQTYGHHFPSYSPHSSAFSRVSFGWSHSLCLLPT